MSTPLALCNLLSRGFTMAEAKRRLRLDEPVIAEQSAPAVLEEATPEEEAPVVGLPEVKPKKDKFKGKKGKHTVEDDDSL